MFAAILVMACGAEPPRFVVEDRTTPAPAFVVVNRTTTASPAVPAALPVPDSPRREVWVGYGTVEWRDGGWWKVAAPEVAAAPSFPPAGSGLDTGVRTAGSSPLPVREPGPSVGTTRTVRTTIPAPFAGPLGDIRGCASPVG